MTTYASVDDVAALWRPLSSDDQARATTLLGYASAQMRQAQPRLDLMLADGRLDPVLVTKVAASVVKRALMNGDREGVENANEAAGPFSRGLTYSNPDGALYLTKQDRRDLGVQQGRRMRTIRVRPSW